MPVNAAFMPKAHHLSFSEIIDFVRQLRNFISLTDVRLTGGEPLLRANIHQLVYELKNLGVESVGLTTNGYFLSSQLDKLKSAGLDNINLSLDSLEKKSFYQMASLKEHDAFEKTIESLLRSLELGFNVKTNTVVMKGLNDDQILPILEDSKRRGYYPRFLELMSLGEGRKYQNHFFSMQSMLSLIHQNHGRSKMVSSPSDSTSVNLKTETGLSFGIIASETEPFCQNCSRLRLSADGKLYGCLMKNEGFSVKSALNNPNELKLLLEQAILMKPIYRIYSSETIMHSIGG
jgi:cyclic pyranopterin phosphate synthase